MNGQKCVCVCGCVSEQAELSWTCVDCRYGRCPIKQEGQTPARGSGR